MKKFVTILTMALLFSVCSATVIASKPMHGRHNGCGNGYVDANGDGICNNYNSNCYGGGKHNGCCSGYVDTNGDGICDNMKYTIKYKLDGGKNSKKNPTYYYNATKNIKLKNPTKKGHTFKGWYTNKHYTKKVTMIKKGSSGQKVFYAKWKKK